MSPVDGNNEQLSKRSESQEQSELHTLTSAMLDGTLDELGRTQLSDRLRDDEEARQFYFDYMRMQTLLETTHSSPLPAVIAGDEADVKAPRTRLQRAWESIHDLATNYAALSMLVSALFLTIIMLSLGMVPEPVTRPGAPAGYESRFVARITNSQDVIWAKPNSPTDFAYLASGRQLSLRSGILEVTFHQGAVVLVEGPAEFHINSRAAGTLSVGRLAARVPRRAVGFTIHTPMADIVDLGTEFGVEVDRAGSHRVEVIEGAVDFLVSSTDQSRQVQAGEVVLLAGGGDETDLKVVSSVNSPPRISRTILARRFRATSRLELQAAVAVSQDGTSFAPKTDAAQELFSDATDLLIRERKHIPRPTPEHSRSLKRRSRLFLEFDVSSLSGRVDQASLQLMISARLPNAGECPIRVARVTSEWNTESGERFPLFDQAFEDAQLTEIDDDTMVGDSVAADMTSIVQGWIDGTYPNHGLVLYFDGREFVGQSYANGENGAAPVLFVVMQGEGWPTATAEDKKKPNVD